MRNLPSNWTGALVLAAALSIALGLFMGDTGTAQQPKSAREKSDFRASMPAPISHDLTGFTAIFDSSSLEGWDGDPAHWRAEDGMIVGESTEENPLERNTFLIWRGGQPANFELVLDYRLDSTNSGVQYRSTELPGAGKWVLKGYQADIDIQNRFTGQIYEERGRGFLAMRGQFTRVPAGEKARVVAEIGDAEELKAVVKNGDWNRLHIIARGNLLVQVLNDQLMSMVIDDDSERRSTKGLLGVQLHTGPPMKIELRNVMLKLL